MAVSFLLSGGKRDVVRSWVSASNREEKWKHFKDSNPLITHLFRPTFQEIRPGRCEWWGADTSTGFILISETGVRQIDLQELVKSKEPGHFIKRGKNRNRVRQMWQLGLRKLPELRAAFHPVNVCALDGKQKVRFIRTLEALSHWLHLQRWSGEKNELLQYRSIRLNREKVIRNLSPRCRCAVLRGIYAARDTSVNTLLRYVALRLLWNDIKVAASQVSARWESVLTKKKKKNEQHATWGHSWRS